MLKTPAPDEGDRGIYADTTLAEGSRVRCEGSQDECGVIKHTELHLAFNDTDDLNVVLGYPVLLAVLPSCFVGGFGLDTLNTVSATMDVV